jgi:hypothetical protein
LQTPWYLRHKWSSLANLRWLSKTEIWFNVWQYCKIYCFHWLIRDVVRIRNFGSNSLPLWFK